MPRLAPLFACLLLVSACSEEPRARSRSGGGGSPEGGGGGAAAQGGQGGGIGGAAEGGEGTGGEPVEPCTGTLADCDGRPGNGCETDTAIDVEHCGRCDLPCADADNAQPACSAGACGIACDGWFADCDAAVANGCEVDTTADPDHCGGCGLPCPGAPNATPTCELATCGFVCNVLQGDCDAQPGNGCEASLAVSNAHCGSCNQACPPGPNMTGNCSGGSCSYACTPGSQNCDNNPQNGCESLQSNAHCGQCNNACPNPQVCQNGDCCKPPGSFCFGPQDDCCGASFCNQFGVCCKAQGQPCTAAECCSGFCGGNGLCL
jgi:hypothetical protein